MSSLRRSSRWGGGGGGSAPKLKMEMEDWATLSRNAAARSDRKGFLTKQGQVNSVSKKRRFFALDGLFLHYYESEDPATAIGVIVLEGSSARVTGKDHGFVLTTCSGREIFLFADNAADRDGWVSVLQHASMQAARDRIKVLEQQLAQQVQRTTDVLRQKTEVEEAHQRLQAAMASDIANAEAQVVLLGETMAKVRLLNENGASEATLPPRPASEAPTASSHAEAPIFGSASIC